MPRKSVTDSLGENVEATPAEVEVVKPDSDYEAQVARESMMASKRALQSAEGPKEVPAPLLEPKPAPPPQSPPPPQPPLTVEIVGTVQEDNVFTQAAATLYDHLSTLAWEWRTRLEAMMEERGLSKSQCVLALIANTLGKNEHMHIPVDHPYFEHTHKAGGTNFVCMECGEVGTRYYAGQPALHAEADKNCGGKFHARPEADQAELMRLNS